MQHNSKSPVNIWGVIPDEFFFSLLMTFFCVKYSCQVEKVQGTRYFQKLKVPVI